VPAGTFGCEFEGESRFSVCLVDGESWFPLESPTVKIDSSRIRRALLFPRFLSYKLPLGTSCGEWCAKSELENKRGLYLVWRVITSRVELMTAVPLPRP
jgi:hypothetical protein